MTARALSLAEVVRFVIVTLTKMAQRKDWGEIRITVQGGQILFVHNDLSYRDRLPTDQSDESTLATVDPTVRRLAAVR